jgi:hypothetical protein
MLSATTNNKVASMAPARRQERGLSMMPDIAWPLN